MQPVGKKGTTQCHLGSHGVSSCLSANSNTKLPEPASPPKTDINTTNSPGKHVITVDEKKIAEKVLCDNKQLIGDKKKQMEDERKRKLQEEQAILKTAQDQIEKKKREQLAQKQALQKEYENNKKVQEEKFKERFSDKKISSPIPEQKVEMPIEAKESIELQAKYKEDLQTQIKIEASKKSQTKKEVLEGDTKGFKFEADELCEKRKKELKVQKDVLLKEIQRKESEKKVTNNKQERENIDTMHKLYEQEEEKVKLQVEEAKLHAKSEAQKELSTKAQIAKKEREEREQQKKLEREEAEKLKLKMKQEKMDIKTKNIQYNEILKKQMNEKKAAVSKEKGAYGKWGEVQVK